MPGTKSLQDQVGEIKKLISDASETLRQANWAMETLVDRLNNDTPAAATPATPVRTVTQVAPPAEPPETGGALPEQQRRHRRWARGAHKPPPGA
jgi:hypothetical protein